MQKINNTLKEQKKNPKKSCNLLGFSVIFSGTQLVDGKTSTNEDHKVWRPL